MVHADASPVPLKGLRVLEVEAIGPVPWACMVLADLGAEIVRVVQPQPRAKVDTHGAVLRGRTVVELDLKAPAGRDAFLALAERADVLVEGMRPGAMERLALGPEQVFARNAAIVYARMTGWGQTGPLAGYAGHDINYIAVAGVLDCIGPRDKPAVPLNLIGDFAGGSCFLLIGILAQLALPRGARQRVVLDAAMVDGTGVLMSLVHARQAMGQWQPGRGNNLLDGGCPWYDTYATLDGKRVAVGALEEKFYVNLVTRLGLQQQLPPREDRSHWDEIRAQFTRVFLTRTRDAWVDFFDGCDACFSPVLTLDEAAQDPHLRARGSFVQAGDARMPAPAPVVGTARFPPAPAAAVDSAANVLHAWQRHRPPLEQATEGDKR